MAAADAEVLRSLYAAFASLSRGHDVAAYVDAFYDADCEYHPVEEVEVVRGRDAMVRWNRRWFEAWTELQVDVDDMTEVGSSVVASLTVRARGVESGLDISQRIFHPLELRDGRVVRMREYVDRAEALEAAGASGVGE